MLLLFTDRFPYGYSEPFLETEIGYLVAGFGRVICVPERAEGPRRPVPAGVEVETSFAAGRPRGAAYLAGALGRTAASPLLYRELASQPHALAQPRALRRAVGYLGEALRCTHWLRAFLHHLKLDSADCTIYTYWLGLATTAAGLLRAEFPQLRLVSRAHGWDLYAERLTPPYHPFREPTLRTLDRLVLISEHGRHYITGRYPWAAQRCVVSRLGVHNPGFTTAPSVDAVLRLVSCSGMLPVKRLDLLIAGLQEFAQRWPTTRLEWHHLGDGPLRPTLEAAARQLPATVTWQFHGQLSNRGVLAFYQGHAVDALVNVSESEGLSVAMMEAQSCGIPVLATAVGGTPEIVGSDNGLLLPHNPTPAEVAQALWRFANANPVETAARRQASHRVWASRFNAAVTYPAFVELLKQTEQQ
ncbi:MAG: glycosyltransferase [Chloroflexaceae bacterium]|jgi:glycosyltransferase involved in cell wall biosynthesis|nr:glycosyltransferase [Chloroflexaceae bacterium]